MESHPLASRAGAEGEARNPDLLILQFPSGIPHEFQLVLETNQATRQCRVIWREENRIGVTFD
jgi:hypothetical protein